MGVNLIAVIILELFGIFFLEMQPLDPQSSFSNSKLRNLKRAIIFGSTLTGYDV